MQHLIELRDVYKIYQMGDTAVHALDGVTLTVDAAGNLVDCALGLLAVGFQYAMMLVIPPSWQFVVMGILSLFMAWAVFRFSRAASGSR